ncbi:hypothetical protein SORBI_3003G032450 [Sorghum bicolor]|uniref:Uncharacterized protein n=1 Tax=Sorghum bicolor TaxID=4558 RepID=A0A1W0VVJ5_SORBI|nr:hypothetical protein SORBI_3003G032450 [Sorghum bicolor]
MTMITLRRHSPPWRHRRRAHLFRCSSLRVLLLFPCLSVALPLLALALGRSVRRLLLLLFFLFKTFVNFCKSAFLGPFEYIQMGVILR